MKLVFVHCNYCIVFICLYECVQYFVCVVCICSCISTYVLWDLRKQVFNLHDNFSEELFLQINNKNDYVANVGNILIIKFLYLYVSLNICINFCTRACVMCIKIEQNNVKKIHVVYVWYLCAVRE